MPPRIQKNAKTIESWTMSRFFNERPELVAFLEDTVCVRLDRGDKRIVVDAPVKSGKRQMAEYIATRDLQKSGTSSVVHIFASAFIRRADKIQRDTLNAHGLSVHCINNDTRVKACLTEIGKALVHGKHVVLHLDEADYGTGEKQHLATLWKEVRTSVVKSIHYTATADELLCSNEDFGTPCVYTPPATYRGAAYFLDNNLVIEATPFFEVVDGIASLTPQGRALLADHAVCMDTDPRRSVIVLRLCYTSGPSNTIDDKAIYTFLEHCHTFPELQTYQIIADKSGNDAPMDGITARDVPWSDETQFKAMVEAKHRVLGAFCQPTLIVMDQKCSRSTELCFHDRLFAFHEFRKEHVYATVAQSQQRVCHYSTKYDSGEQPIRVYGHVATFERAAGRITRSDYVDDGHKLSERVASRRTQSTNAEVEFHPCTPENFADLYLPVKFNNPFDATRMEGNKYQGYLRAWKVFDYEEVRANKRWGLHDAIPARVTVCYKEGVLGVAFRYIVDAEGLPTDDNHSTVKSMYL